MSSKTSQYFTNHEQQFALDVANKIKSYGFYIIEDGRMFYDKDSPKEISKNHLICMLRKDIKHALPKKRFEKLLYACVKAMILMAQSQIQKQLTQTE
jgi:hypothetical protein